MQHLRGPQESILGRGANPRRPLGATMGHDSVSPLFSKLMETRMDELLLRVEQCALMQPEAKDSLLIGSPRSLISGPSEPLDHPALERRAHELLTGLIRYEVVRRGARRGRTSPVLETKPAGSIQAAVLRQRSDSHARAAAPPVALPVQAMPGAAVLPVQAVDVKQSDGHLQAAAPAASQSLYMSPPSPLRMSPIWSPDIEQYFKRQCFHSPRSQSTPPIRCRA